MSFQVADGANMDSAFTRICSELFWLQIHQCDFTMAVLIDNNLCFKILSQVQKYFLLAQAVGEEKYAVLRVGAHNINEALVSFFSAWKVVLGVRKSVIHVQIIAIHSDAFKLRVSFTNRA